MIHCYVHFPLWPLAIGLGTRKHTLQTSSTPRKLSNYKNSTVKVWEDSAVWLEWWHVFNRFSKQNIVHLVLWALSSGISVQIKQNLSIVEDHLYSQQFSFFFMRSWHLNPGVTIENSTFFVHLRK